MTKFEKGHVSWLKGKFGPHNPLWKGRPKCEVCGISISRYAKRCRDHPKEVSLEHRHNMSVAKIGISNVKRIGQKHSSEAKEKMRIAKIGKKHTEEHNKKIRLASHRKEKAWNWVSDRNKLKKYIGSEERRNSKYKEWRKQVCDRDNWKCRLSNSECKGRLEVHHIYNYNDNEELRYVINNGITLCHFHHPRGMQKEKQMIPIFQELLL